MKKSFLILLFSIFLFLSCEIISISIFEAIETSNFSKVDLALKEQSFSEIDKRKYLSLASEIIKLRRINLSAEKLMQEDHASLPSFSLNYSLFALLCFSASAYAHFNKNNWLCPIFLNGLGLVSIDKNIEQYYERQKAIQLYLKKLYIDSLKIKQSIADSFNEA